MFQCTFITCMGKGILPLRYNDIKKLRAKILLWMETVTHVILMFTLYWLSGKRTCTQTSESLILFNGEMSGKFGKPSGDSWRAFGHCRKTHREHSESLRVILGEYSDIVVKRILTTRGFRDVSRFWNSGGWQVCNSYTTIVAARELPGLRLLNGRKLPSLPNLVSDGTSTVTNQKDLWEQMCPMAGFTLLSIHEFKSLN